MPDDAKDLAERLISFARMGSLQQGSLLKLLTDAAHTLMRQKHRIDELESLLVDDLK